MSERPKILLTPYMGRTSFIVSKEMRDKVKEAGLVCPTHVTLGFNEDLLIGDRKLCDSEFYEILKQEHLHHSLSVAAMLLGEGDVEVLKELWGGADVVDRWSGNILWTFEEMLQVFQQTEETIEEPLPDTEPEEEKVDHLDYKEEQKAIRYNERRGYPKSFVKKVQEMVGAEETGDWDEAAVEAVAQWQHEEGLTVDGMVGPNTKDRMTEGFPREERVLTEDEKDKIIAFTTRHEGGHRNPYSACNRDGEWKGLFDRPKKDSKGNRIPPNKRYLYPNFDPNGHSQYHPSGGSHVGLSWGAWQVTQDAGTLGRVLQFAFDEEPEVFVHVFGGEEAAKELLEVTQRKGGDEGGTRSPRVQPVQGVDLWEEPWVSRFKKAGTLEVFQRAQRKGICKRLNRILDPDREFNVWDFGFTSQGEIAVLFDISVQFGLGGMTKRWRRALGSPVAGETYDIMDVIRELPEKRQDRRVSILKEADSWVHYRRPDDEQ